MPVELIGNDAWNATITAPAGGDPRNSASVRTLGQRLADNVQYLKNRLGALANVTIAHHDQGIAVAPSAPSSTSENAFNGAAWKNATNVHGNESVTVSNLRPGDHVLVQAQFTTRVTAANAQGHMRIGDATLNEAVPGAYVFVTSTTSLPCTLFGIYTATAVAATKTFYLMGYVESSVPGSLSFIPQLMTAIVFQS